MAGSQEEEKKGRSNRARIEIIRKIWGDQKVAALCDHDSEEIRINRFFDSQKPYISAYTVTEIVLGKPKAQELHDGSEGTSNKLMLEYRKHELAYNVMARFGLTSEYSSWIFEKDGLTKPELEILNKPETSAHAAKSWLHIFRYGKGPEKAREFVKGGKIDSESLFEYMEKAHQEVYWNITRGAMWVSEVSSRIFGDEGSRRGEKLKGGGTAFH